MTPRGHRVVRNAVLAATIGCIGVACGQRGPLVLPEKARPIERVEVPPQPAPTPAPAPQRTPEQQDDEQKK
jgi:predicted small lipoprotein YifL